MRVIISESQFSRLIESCLITEGMGLKAVWETYYPDITAIAFGVIVTKFDPTYVEGSNKIGRYAKWLLNMFRAKRIKLGDEVEIREMLTIFDRVKQRLEIRDITQVKSVEQLYNLVIPYMGNGKAISNKEQERNIKAGGEKVYDDAEWTIIVPHTKEASNIYGKGTKWCTAADNGNMFSFYNNKGPLFINIRKSDGAKFQFHFETNSFMDAQDHPIRKPINKSIGLGKPVLSFYQNKVGKLGSLSLFMDRRFVLRDGYGIWRDENNYSHYVNAAGQADSKKFDGYYAAQSRDASVFYTLNDKKLYKGDKDGLTDMGYMQESQHNLRNLPGCKLCNLKSNADGNLFRVSSYITYNGKVILQDAEVSECSVAYPVNGVVWLKSEREDWVPFIANTMKRIPLSDDILITNCEDFTGRDAYGIYAMVEINTYKYIYKLYKDGRIERTEYTFDDDIEGDYDSQPDYGAMQ